MIDAIAWRRISSEKGTRTTIAGDLGCVHRSCLLEVVPYAEESVVLRLWL